MHTLKHLPAGRHGAAGFSIIEALIAAAILLIIALGLLPLFTRSINDNVSGNDATQATNGSRTQVEELLNVPFNNDRMEVPAGATNSEVKTSYTPGALDKTGDTDEGWWADPAGHGTVLWRRTSEVRQYTVSDLDDRYLDDPKPGGTEATFVHFKEVTVTVANPKKNLFGNGQGITLKVIKPF
ncbi:MAG: prepilin-type N-terminal cleavage/methylation domain-containing protein [Thermoanaerobaculia bacterium]